jgi:putative membrane protein insertion efficiency factor
VREKNFFGLENEVFTVKKTSGFSKAVPEGKTGVHAVFDDVVQACRRNAHGHFDREKTREERSTKPYQTLDKRSVSSVGGRDEGAVCHRAGAQSAGGVFLSRLQSGSDMDDAQKQPLTLGVKRLFRENWRYLRKRVFKPYVEMLCLRMILFYQKYFSRHTCMFRPTCSQYALECIHNHGVIVGILLGCLRILRCNPFAKAGKRDPAPEVWRKKKWLL